MLCALIMAGGVGSRFWPQSTEETPKQFLKLINDKTMIQMTYDRINKLVDDEHIFIITNERYIDIIKEQLPKVKDVNIITEPCSRNTCPCILLSSLYLKNLYGNCNVVCISSDSYIKNEDKFIEDIKVANEFLNNNKETIVTIGIEPNRPETGYGYVKYINSNEKVLKVEKFVEKPDLKTAQKYLLSNEYLWNAGMFIFNTDYMLKEIKNNNEVNYNLLEKLPNHDDKNYKDFLNSNYEKCEKISIDYAVMEKSKNIYTIPTNIGWDDVGTWPSLERYIEKDTDSNVLKGDVKAINSKNNIVFGNNKKVVLYDIDNIFCIDSDDVIVIGNKDKISEVPKIKDQL